MIRKLFVLSVLSVLCFAASAHAVLSSEEKTAVATVNAGMVDSSQLVTSDSAHVTSYLTATQALSQSIEYLLGRGKIIGSNRASDVANAWIWLDTALAQLTPLPAASSVVASLHTIDRSLTFLVPQSSSFPWVSGLVGNWDDGVQRVNGAVHYLTESGLRQNNLTYSQTLMRLVPSFGRVLDVLTEKTETPPSAQSMICAVGPLLSQGAIDLFIALDDLTSKPPTFSTGDFDKTALNRYSKAWNSLDRTSWALADHVDLFGPCP